MMDHLKFLLETEGNIFLTGKAGTGKSTLINQFCEHFVKTNKIVKLAPTGIAAYNIGGQTIHSFFKFKITTTIDSVYFEKELAKICKSVKVIIIDEVSMLRPDLLDCIDQSLRLHTGKSKSPFGDIKMIFVGDLYQLEPVVKSDELLDYETKYFFSAKVFKYSKLKIKELDKIHRQNDPVFIDFLNKVRLGNLSYLELNQLNHLLSTSLDRELITLTTTNHKALIINNENLLKNNHPEEFSSAVIDGEFNSNNILAEEELVLKYDCKVMILANGTCFDDPNKAYFNGSIGLFRGFDVRWKKEYDEEEGKKVDVAIPVAIVNLEGHIIVVKEFTWSNFQYVEVKNTNSKTNKITITIELQQVGSFTQIPLKLGYAFSIHKSQGLTFDGINIDLGQQTFSNGQLYVALSRCRTLEGINMFRKIYPSDIRKNKIIDNYLKENQNAARF